MSPSERQIVGDSYFIICTVHVILEVLADEGEVVALQKEDEVLCTQFNMRN